MPELPEVQSVVDSLREALAGRTFVSVNMGPHDVVTPDGFDLVRAVQARRIVSLHRRAKRIVFLLDDGNHFFIHLGMTGQLTLEPADAPLKKHTHLVADVSRVGTFSSLQLRFVDPRRFGEIRWLGGSAEDGTLGPEPLSMRVSTFARQLGKTRRAIKVALLDQRTIAGIGNIYADEALHGASIAPRIPADALSAEQVAALSKSIKSVLRRAIRAGGSTLRDYVNGRGERGGFQTRHRVYDRAGKPCRKCATPIERIVLGGRSTHFCPSCQR